MSNYIVTIPMTVNYTVVIERDEEGMTKEELMEFVDIRELGYGELAEVCLEEIEHFSKMPEVEVEED